jgi:hypothetical protein
VVELANAFEPVQDGRIYIEKINGRSCISSRARLRNTKPGLSAPSRTAGSTCMRAFGKFTEAGATLFAQSSLCDLLPLNPAQGCETHFILPASSHAVCPPGNRDMLLYRAYLMENGHVWTAVDLSCADDDDAKQQTESLLDERDIELWQGDRRVAVLDRMRRGIS